MLEGNNVDEVGEVSEVDVVDKVNEVKISTTRNSMSSLTVTKTSR